MNITLNVPNDSALARTCRVVIDPAELARAHLLLSFPEQRNRTDRYMRRHGLYSKGDAAGSAIDPNEPDRSDSEPRKLPIPDHIRQMQEGGSARESGGITDCADEISGTEPAMFAVPISDLTANLMRPSFHRDGLGTHRIFHFDAEPIERRPYWCVCCFEEYAGKVELAMQWVRFEPESDRVFGEAGTDLLDAGLSWAAGLVPIVVAGRPLTAVEITRNDYDLRQIVGREATELAQYAYAGWFDEWDERVAQIVARHAQNGAPWSSFYHSVLGIDKHNRLHVMQLEASLPDLALTLAGEGIVHAGVLDSGGSCALYDVWMASYLNQSWYFREPRGSVLVFELARIERLPRADRNSWLHRRERV